jgi:PncC family amidohydrolase
MTLLEEVTDALRAQNLTVCTAESCTGGMVAARLTNQAGSSAFMLGGVIAYANEIKRGVLNVPEQTLIDYGSVSEATAQAMALGARRLIGADYALSVTGVAGPGGGTDDKPLGLTFIGIAGPDNLLTVERQLWQHDRAGNREASVNAALRLLRNYL